MAFTTEEYLIIENLVHLSGLTNAKPGHTIGELINGLDSTDYSGGLMSQSEWKEMIGEISSNPEYQDIMDLKIADTHVDNCIGGGGGRMAVFMSDSGEAVVAFAGSAQGEWADNFEGGSFTSGSDGVSTPQQENALQWYKEKYSELGLDRYDVTAIGHSKGGNKAKYISLMDETIGKCVSFDGQGFSDEFYAKYLDKIASNQYKIENHNLDNDPVNLLLNDVGDTTYYRHQASDNNYIDAHNPYGLFKNGKLELADVCEQATELKAMDRFLNSLLRSLPPVDKVDVMTFLGMVVQDAQYGNFSLDEIMNDPNSRIKLAYMAAFAIEYSNQNPQMYEYLKTALGNMGLDDLKEAIEPMQAILENQWLRGFLLTCANTAPHIAYEMIKDKLDISYEDFVKLKKFLTLTHQVTTIIEVHPDKGLDFKVGSGFERVKADFYIQTELLKSASEELTAGIELLQRTKQELIQAKQNISIYQVVSLWNLNHVINNLDSQRKYLIKLKEGIRNIANLYEQYDARVVNAVPNI